jgi:hypothetical protein
MGFEKMSLKRAKDEMERAYECKNDDHRSLIFIKLAIYEIIEFLENLNLEDSS